MGTSPNSTGGLTSQAPYCLALTTHSDSCHCDVSKKPSRQHPTPNSRKQGWGHEKCSDMVSCTTAGGYDSELEGALAAGHVGAPLQPGDRALLRLRPLRHYEAGELVAIKRRLPAAALPGQAAAAAAEARAAAAAGTAEAGTAVAAGGGDEGGQVLCYGRVAMDAAPQPGQAAYRLSVEVAPGVYESILSTQVFCFQSGAQHTQAAAAAAATDVAGTAAATAAAAAGASSSSSGAGVSATAAGAGADAAGPTAATQQVGIHLIH